MIGCGAHQKNYTQVTGFTQGTTFNIIYSQSVDLSEQIDSLLLVFDNSLSVFKDSSLISQVNRNETDSIDRLILRSYELSRFVYDLSGGLFDPTVSPLIEAYGFRDKSRKYDVLSQDELSKLMSVVGLSKISISEGVIIKQSSGIELDFNGIAQGLSVDYLCEYFNSRGIADYMVEVGGEVYATGVSPRGGHWRIGIDSPTEGNFVSGADLATVIELSGRGLATSGNYRNFIDSPSGERLTHTLDPRTGHTVSHNLLSVTILAKEAALADAIATACMVGGYQWTVDFIPSLSDTLEVEAYLIYSGENSHDMLLKHIP